MPASFTISSQAQTNLLVNPGAESSSSAFTGWTLVNNAGYNFAVATLPAPHSGARSFNISGDFNITTSTNLAYQSFAATNGQIFTAEGWAYQQSGDDFTGGNPNTAYIEVSFRDASNKVLSRFRSRVINGTFPLNSWNDLAVTNQVNPTNETSLGAVTSLVAPANVSTIRYDLVFSLVNANSGSVYWDDLKLASGTGAAATPPTLTIGVTNAVPTLKFTTQSGFNYALQYKSALTLTTWTNLGSIVVGDGTLKSVQDSSITTGSQRFYRVQVQ